MILGRNVHLIINILKHTRNREKVGIIFSYLGLETENTFPNLVATLASPRCPVRLKRKRYAYIHTFIYVCVYLCVGEYFL